jgi:hypothetical protein
MMARLPLARIFGGGSCSDVQPNVSMFVNRVSFAYLLHVTKLEGNAHSCSLYRKRLEPSVVRQRHGLQTREHGDAYGQFLQVAVREVE